MVRFGIIGFGLHAEKRLVPAFRQCRRARLMAITRRDRQRARQSAEQYGVPEWFDSAEELCRSPQVDAVFVATPNVLHCADTLTALAAGKPVLCEKPMAMNAAECERMIAAARRGGVLLGVAQVFRFARTVERMRELVAAGEIGRPALARAEFCYAGIGHARRWIHDRSVGGGATADVGVHCIDALRFMLQDEVTGVDARATFDAQSGECDASAVLSLQFARGTLATVMVSMRAEYRTPLELVGDTGALRVQRGFSVDAPAQLDLVRQGAIARVEEMSNSDAFARQIDSFAAAVEGGGAFICPGEEGWRNQTVLDAAYDSMRRKGASVVRSGSA